MLEPQFAHVRMTSAAEKVGGAVRERTMFRRSALSEPLAASSIAAHNSDNAPVDRPTACNAPQRDVDQLPAQAGAQLHQGDGATR